MPKFVTHSLVLKVVKEATMIATWLHKINATSVIQGISPIKNDVCIVSGRLSRVN